MISNKYIKISNKHIKYHINRKNKNINKKNGSYKRIKTLGKGTTTIIAINFILN